MRITFEEKVGEGAFADVWAARDDLGRRVAVKIIRRSLVGMADALAHAKALARVNHTNIVRVYSLDSISHPETGEESDCVVMELVDGQTLRGLLRGTCLTREELQRIGNGLIEGVAEIHKNGLPHGDLHADNIMVSDTQVKILDILYLESLSALSTMKQQDLFDRDVRSLRIIILELISKSQLDPAEAGEFNSLLGLQATLDQLKIAFEKITSPETSSNASRQLEHCYARFLDERYVDSDEYAYELAAVTPKGVSSVLLDRVISECTFESSRGTYVRHLWLRLEEEDRQRLLSSLAKHLDCIPDGKWWPNLKLLITLGEHAWNELPKLTRLRVESLVINDTLAGYYNVFSSSPLVGGAIGTYANAMWGLFSEDKLAQLAEHLISLLGQGWYTQNYVGHYFMAQLAPIADLTNKRERMVDAIYLAFKNDAREVVANMAHLAPDWSARIQSRAKAADPTRLIDPNDHPF